MKMHIAQKLYLKLFVKTCCKTALKTFRGNWDSKLISLKVLFVMQEVHGKLIGLNGLLPVCNAGDGELIGLKGLLPVCYAGGGELIGLKGLVVGLKDRSVTCL